MSESPSKFLVAIVVPIAADSPSSAVRGLVELFTTRGLRGFTYSAAEVVDGEAVPRGYFDGFGEPKQDGTNSPSVNIDLPTLSTPVTEVRTTS